MKICSTSFCFRGGNEQNKLINELNRLHGTIAQNSCSAPFDVLGLLKITSMKLIIA